MASIKYDGTEICNGTYIPRYVRHETIANRELSVMPLAREDGRILISEKYDVKHILLSGKITGATRSALEGAIDDFKELFGRSEKNLDISWAGGTRRYVSTCIRHSFDRDYFHELFVPWTAEFIVPSGIGTNPTLTGAADQWSADPTYSGDVTISGSAKPRPTISLTFGANWVNAKGISFECTDIDEKLVLTKYEVDKVDAGWGTATDVIEIDCDNKKVEYEDLECGFYGVFPSFVIGANNIEIKAGDLIDQQFVPATFSTLTAIHGNNHAAQSFTVPHTDDTYQGIHVYISKSGAPPNALSIRIETDSSGAPSGNLADANATFSIAAASVGSATWEFVNSTNTFELAANTRYWIVLETTAGDGSNCYNWYYLEGTGADYGRGNGSTSADAGVSWTDKPTRDYDFKLTYGGKVDSPAGTLTLDIDYYRRYL